ncbi:MAG: hypothetical protein ACXVY5_03175 [Gaiellales bacterium]
MRSIEVPACPGRTHAAAPATVGVDAETGHPAVRVAPIDRVAEHVGG